MAKRGYGHEDAYSKSITSVLRWMGVQFLLVIPILNIILVLIWAFSSRHPSKRNYCIAAILWFLIFVALSSVAVYQFDNSFSSFVKNINGNWNRVPEIIELIGEKGREIYDAMDPAARITPEPGEMPTLPPENTLAPEETFMPEATPTRDTVPTMPDPTTEASIP